MREFDEIKGCHAQLDKMIQGLGEPLLEHLGPISLPDPPADSAAFRFYYAVSWLYVAVIEVGGITFRFLVSRARPIGIDSNGELADFMRDIQALRTLLQHHLDAANRSDAAKLELAGRWLIASMGKDALIGANFWPIDGKQWISCEERLNRLAKEFFAKVSEVVRHIETDEFKRDTLDEWARRCSRSLAPHIFDKLIEAGIRRLGLPFLDPVRVRARHYQNWSARLRLMSEAADLTLEAERLVDAGLLSDWTDYCPLSGDDIIIHLGLPPGPKVGNLLLKARQIWQEKPCSAQELLNRLRSSLEV